MCSKRCETPEEEIDDNGVTSSSTNKTNSTTSCRSRRSQKVSWIPSPEKETYRTVVVNYGYAKKDKNYPHNLGAVSKNKHFNRMIAATAAKQNSDEEAEDDDVPNLRKLYDYSKEDLCTYKTPDTPVPSCENITASRKNPKTEAIKLEVYCMPMEQEATVEDQKLNTIEENDAESANLHGDDYNDDETKSQYYSDERIYEATDNSADTTRMTVSYPLCTDFVLLSDSEIGETTDFGADFCCAMTENEEDGTQQTCIIKNTTKATQSPERHNKRLQTARRSRMRGNVTPSTQNDDNGLQLTVAEIPKDSGKSNPPPMQSGFRQRQQELHRYRIAVEQKRLELLEVKLQRERDEMLREQILFEKEIELKATQLTQFNDDRGVDIM